MAEYAVSIVIDYLVSLLAEEVNLLRGVHREFESIKCELEFIKPYLKDADERAEKGESNDGVKALVKRVRKVSYRIEDVIDEYILHLLTQRSDQRRGFISFLYKVAQSIIKCKPRQEIASEIQEIKTTLHEIHELRNRYGLHVKEEGSSSSSSSNVKNESTWHDPRVASLFLDEAEVVGIESPRAELTTLMAEEASPKRTVISVVGEGGLGKTTLVKKVYDDQVACGNFVCHAWITVSQSYNNKDLLRTVMKKFCETTSNGIETIEEASLIGKLREYLQRKRYVVIFDDVWDMRFWNFIKPALPDDNKGSRVIITTRNNGVATSCIESKFDKIYELNHLSHEKAWDLFCKSAFQSDYGGICPPALKEVSDEIVRKCNGVPLAIVMIGRLLSTKDKVVLQWQNFSNRLGSELKSNPHREDVKKIILFSYLDLPYHLKPCFLYFGILPEDYSIRHGRLIRLWIAEGFVKEDRGKTLEEIAEENLKELIHRSLVQISRGYTVDQKVQ
ncbi:disease resistance protein RPM1-like [Cornus florida]|uniref:disease resistance protein RPM1-like n=1 Tax=Cornus florida TaxID=4283 RepID=UPI0028986900|nr:disease resistance protein RPM1-like [Cornus florida]